MRLVRNRQGLYEAQTTRNRSKTFQSYNKAWHVGDKVSVFFPIYWNPERNEDGTTITVPDTDVYGKELPGVYTEKGSWDVVVASIWGHRNNAMKELKLPSFIPSLTDIIDGRPVKFVRDDKGEIIYTDGEPQYTPIEGDVTYQFSQIAPVFIKGRKKAKLDRIANKNWASLDLMRTAMQQVEDEFDTTKSMDAPRPAIGKCMLYISTEVLVVPVRMNDDYDVSRAAIYTYDFNSSAKAEAIMSLLNDVKYKPHDLSQKWFEVQFTYNGTTDDTAGRAAAARKAAPIGLTPEFTMQMRNPTAFEALQPKLSQLPEDSDIITHRNFSYRKKEEAVIQRALEAYSVNHSEDLDSANDAEDKAILLRNVKRLASFNVFDSLQNQELALALRERYAVEGGELVPDSTGPSEDAPPTIRSLLAGTSEPDLLKEPLSDILKE